MRILGGVFKGRVLPTLDAKGCRPAMAKVRQALFDMLASSLGGMQGLRVLDVFAGTGSLGIEALSRGAAYVGFVERDKALARRITENCRRLGLQAGQYAVFNGDARTLLAKPQAKAFDLVFVDPPYGKELLAPVLELLAAGWLAQDGVVVAEVEKQLDINAWPAHLELTTDRAYGQTRILIWNQNPTAPPSTPEPSTP